MRILCTDHNCKYCADTGYYGLCKKRSSENSGYGGIDRMLVETYDLCEKGDTVGNSEKEI